MKLKAIARWLYDLASSEVGSPVSSQQPGCWTGEQRLVAIGHLGWGCWSGHLVDLVDIW